MVAWGSHDRPQVGDGGVGEGGDDVIQWRVRGERGLRVLALGGCTLTTGNISARYTTAESPGGQQQH